MSIPFSFPASKKLHFSRNGVEKSCRIHIPLEQEEYEDVFVCPRKCRSKIDLLIKKYTRLFPKLIKKGYWFHDIRKSKKLKLKFRRIKLKDGKVFMLVPFFVMPYMTGFTKDVDKPLFLRKFAVPYSALTYVFGKSDMYWYRLEKHIGKNSIVGTTIRRKSRLPLNLLADEKHSRENRRKIYIPITVAKGCILGASVVEKADHPNLLRSYLHFKKEAQNLAPGYIPDSVNTDGWKATQWSWQKMFPYANLILCFLHSFLKVRNNCNNIGLVYKQLVELIWDAYHSENAAEFYEKISVVKLWAKKNIKNKKALKTINKLCEKRSLFAHAYFFPKAHRTSNMLDRLFDRLDRFIYSCKYFHGHRQSSEYSVRAWAIMHNFLPYSNRSCVSKSFISPAHKINGFVYNQNWIKNLILSTSMGGFRK